MTLPAVPYVVVLGVAQDAGHPQAGCRQDCCRPAWADPSLGHLVACLGIVDPRSGQRWIIDATPDLARQLHALDALQPGTAEAPALDGIFLTHAHTGHYSGLMQLGRETMGCRDLPLHAMPRMQQFLRGNAPWSQLVEHSNVQLRSLQAGNATTLSEGLSIVPFVVPHRDEFSETVGFIISGVKRRIAWLPDIDSWDRWDRPIEEFIGTVDAAFIDGTFYDSTELHRDIGEIPHPLICDSMERLAGLPDSQRARVRFIHLNHTNPVLRADSPERAEVRQMGFSIGRRGEVIDLS